jgi:hypothetical protein
MKNRTRKVVEIVTVFIAIFALTGCAVKPVLSQVSDGVQETSINTPEKSAELIQKNSK